MTSLAAVMSEFGWCRAAVLGAANAGQVALTWSILRDAALTTRPPSARVRVLQVTALIAANTLQTGLTWWLYRLGRDQHHPVDDSGASQLSGGQ